MVENPRFQIRDTEEELQKLDEALLKLGYIKRNGSADRSRWYEDMKNKTIEEFKNI